MSLKTTTSTSFLSRFPAISIHLWAKTFSCLRIGTSCEIHSSRMGHEQRQWLRQTRLSLKLILPTRLIEWQSKRAVSSPVSKMCQHHHLRPVREKNKNSTHLATCSFYSILHADRILRVVNLNTRAGCYAGYRQSLYVKCSIPNIIQMFTAHNLYPHI